MTANRASTDFFWVVVIGASGEGTGGKRETAPSPRGEGWAPGSVAGARIVVVLVELGPALASVLRSATRKQMGRVPRPPRRSRAASRAPPPARGSFRARRHR